MQNRNNSETSCISIRTKWFSTADKENQICQTEDTPSARGCQTCVWQLRRGLLMYSECHANNRKSVRSGQLQ